MIALKIAREKDTIDQTRYMHLLDELHAVPEKVKEVLKTSERDPTS